MSNDLGRARFNSEGETKASKDSRTLPTLVKAVAEQAISDLASAVSVMLDNADDALFDLSEKSSNNKEQAVFFEAMRELRVRRKGMENVFTQEIKNAFVQLTRPQLTKNSIVAEDFSLENFSLVKDDELEENLAFDGIISKARNTNKEALGHLVTRIDHLVASNRVEESNHPLDPRQICQAFRSAAERLELDVKTKLIIYKLFERNVINCLGDIYADLNELLAENGVLPDLHLRRPKIKRERHFKPPQRRHGESRHAQSQVQAKPAASSSSDEGENQEVFNVLQELLSVNKRHPATGAQNDPVVDTSQLVSALSSLQHTALPAVEQGQVLNAAELRVLLAQRLPLQGGPLNGEAIGRVNDDVIDIVAMLFDFILDDSNLHNDVKAVIARLQIPMLKVGLVDRQFFSRRSHPARKLLNTLARAGLGWNPQNKNRDPLLQKIESVVERIHTEFEDNIGLFEELLADFQVFQENERKRAQIIEKRTREAEEGKAKADSARGQVNKEIRRICTGQHMPPVVKGILRDAWTNVMFLEHLRSGAGSREFKKSVQVAEKLVWSVQPDKSKEQLRELRSVIPLLVRELKNGLNSISFSAFQSSQFFEELEECHINLIRESVKKLSQPPAEKSTEQAVPTPAVTKTEVEQITLAGGVAETSEEQAIDVPEHCLRAVNKLEVGDWIEMTNELSHGTPLRCKLAAKIIAMDKLIFVNRAGLKVADFTLPALAVSVSKKEVRLLDDTALFDRALESVISNLRQLKQDAG